MKRILYLWLSLMMIVSLMFSVSLAWQEEEPAPKEVRGQGDWTTKQDPIGVLDSVKRNANRNYSNQVQKTTLDYTISQCVWDAVPAGVGYTITKTLCNIKVNIRAYLQYAIFAWLAAATIFIIRNGFLLVTSPDRWKQMWVFKKNIVYSHREGINRNI